jgi:hypothetical protein
MTYRQYDYHAMMQHSSQLARWLHKRLSHNYTNASYMTPYECLFSSVKRDSGLLEYQRDRDSVRKLDEAMDELQDRGILIDFNRKEQRGARNRILDVKYTLSPHPDFVKQIKAANKRLSDSRQQLKSLAGASRP